MSGVMTNFVQRADRNGPTWGNWNTSSNQGEVDAGTTVSQMMRDRGMDYEIKKHPTAVIYTDSGGKQYRMDDGNVRLVREPRPGSRETPIILGEPVKPGFGIVQNMEIARFLDPFVSQWPIETAGEFDNGTTVYVGLKAGGTTIGGDEMRDYFIVSDIRDGGHSINLCYTPVRVVCWNTLMMSLSKATTRIKLAHIEGVAKDTEFFIEFMARMRGVQTTAREKLATYAAHAITDEQARSIINAAHRESEKPTKLTAIEALREHHERESAVANNDRSFADVKARMEQFQQLDAHAKATGGKTFDEMIAEWERMRERVAKHREAAFGLYQAEKDSHEGRGSVFLAVQAVAEYADWRMRDPEDTETIAEGSLFGRRQDEKMRAVAVAEKLLARA